MTKEWKERLEKIGFAVIPAVVVVVLGALIKGDELKGLSKLAAILRILNLGVPLWLFLITLITSVLAGVRWFKSRRREIVHVQWKEDHCFWSAIQVGTNKQMQIRLSGFITNSDAELGLFITSIYLDGTRPARSLYEIIELPAANVCEEDIDITVEPLVVPEGVQFRGNVILVDQFQEKHKAYIKLRAYPSQGQAKPITAEKK